ncbi:MAG TPA: hypothetical protein VNM14_22545 [Planctomycetota bacterium]|jgi:hypothetical protein|nr:hypothetical protein [Planctomycetota bacterium]
MRWRTMAWLCFLVLASLGCTVRHIREAQDSFNEAAGVENQQRFDRAPRNGIRDLSSATANYKLALAAVNAELESNPSDLQAENLLATALMLKALCLWRIADLDNSDERGNEMGTVLKAIDDLVAKKTLTLGTRDQVLLKALPGLRDHDRGLRAKTLETAKPFFKSCFAVLDSALSDVKPPENHPIWTYVRLAQLSTLIAWKDAVFRHRSDPNERRTEMAEPNASFDSSALLLKPRWATDPSLYPAVVQLCKEMGRTPPPE